MADARPCKCRPLRCGGVSGGSRATPKGRNRAVFGALRGAVDEKRSENGRFVVLGSAQPVVDQAAGSEPLGREVARIGFEVAMDGCRDCPSASDRIVRGSRRPQSNMASGRTAARLRCGPLSGGADPDATSVDVRFTAVLPSITAVRSTDSLLFNETNLQGRYM